MAGEVHIPEVWEPDESLPADLVALRRFALLMDEAVPVPGTGRRIGLDAGLSLIPVVGDIVAALFSVTIIAGALRHRVPLPRVMGMVAYVVLDMLVGEIPVLGTIFDWLFEENVMNMRTLLKYRNRKLPPRSVRQISGILALIIGLILLIGLLTLVGAIAFVIWLAAHRNG
ncbi:MAG TPA: DUF4112 domain-containing protein [Thermoanaerobaculia bacterium]|nr:DUF4112 domain-containing protein [Thermoanaerobaculia bacterium]